MDIHAKKAEHLQMVLYDIRMSENAKKDRVFEKHLFLKPAVRLRLADLAATVIYGLLIGLAFFGIAISDGGMPSFRVTLAIISLPVLLFVILILLDVVTLAMDRGRS